MVGRAKREVMSGSRQAPPWMKLRACQIRGLEKIGWRRKRLALAYMTQTWCWDGSEGGRGAGKQMSRV